MNINFKKLILITTIFLSSCSTYILKDVKYKNLNNDWEISRITPNIMTYQLGFVANNKDLLPVRINISNFKSEFGELWMWWIPPIPLISYSNKDSNCRNDFYIKFEMVKTESNQMFLETNKVIFDTSKVFIMKNGKRQKINLTPLATDGIVIIDPIYSERENEWEKDFNMDVSNYLLSRTAIQTNIIILSVGRQFSSPFGCRAVDNTVLEIGGISINGKELEPIKINMSYKNK